MGVILEATLKTTPPNSKTNPKRTTMINYEEITGVSVGEVHFTPEMVIQACKDSVKAAIPLILKGVSKKAKTTKKKIEYTGVRAGGSYFVDVVDKKSIISLQNSLEKQLGI